MSKIFLQEVNDTQCGKSQVDSKKEHEPPYKNYLIVQKKLLTPALRKI